MIILHNKYDQKSREFVADALTQYGTAVVVIDWTDLFEDERSSYVRAGLSPSAFPSVIAETGERQIARTTPDGEPVLDESEQPIIDTIPARLSIIRRPETPEQAEAESSAIGRPATLEELNLKLNESAGG